MIFPVVSSYLEDIYNTIITTARFLKNWNCACPKSKIFEVVVNDQVTDYLIQNTFISDMQSAYIK